VPTICSKYLAPHWHNDVEVDKHSRVLPCHDYFGQCGETGATVHRDTWAKLRPWQRPLLVGVEFMLLGSLLLFVLGVIGLIVLTPLGWPWLTSIMWGALFAGVTLMGSAWIGYVLVRL
jgi:hypothetical protein